MHYVAFLRAINVGGRTLPMVRLRELMSSLGFAKVATYIQTGNVFFESDDHDARALEVRIATALKEALGFEVATFVRELSELRKSIATHPFRDMQLIDDTRHCVAFLSHPLPQDALPYRSAKGDAEILSMTSGEAFILMRLRNGRPTNIAAIIEKDFSVVVTIRFVHTMVKLLDAAADWATK